MAGGIEVAKAYVALVPKFENLGKTISGEVGGVDLSGAGAKAGNSFTSSFGKNLKSIGSSISGVGQSLTNNITKPALLAGTALGGLLIIKGLKRVIGIDQARAQLMGLGHDADSVKSIMNSALESVKGTAFGMDEAATTAATAVAAGVKKGAPLTKYLKTIGDAAAIANIPLGEMGPIFNKVQTSGKAYTDVLNQLSDRGLPIFQWLADAAGKSTDEISKMASEGKISSELFNEAIEKNIGGAAAIIGENSFTATLSNISAAIGRIGANLMGDSEKGLFATLKPLMVSFKSVLGSIEPIAASLGEKLGAAFIVAIEKVQELYKVLFPAGVSIEGLGTKFDELPAKVGAAFDTVIAFVERLKESFNALPIGVQEGIMGLAANLPLILIAAGPVLQIVGKLVSGFGTLVTVFGTLAPLMTGAGFTALTAAIGPFLIPLLAVVAAFVLFKDQIVTGLMPVFEVLKEAWASISASFAEQMPAITKNLQPLIDLWTSAKDAVNVFFSFVTPILVAIVKGFTTFAKGAVKAIAPITKVIGGLAAIFSGALKIIIGIVTLDGSKIKAGFLKMWSGIKNVFSGAFAAMGAIGKAIMKGLFAAISSLVGSIVGVVKSIWAKIKGAFSGAGGAMGNIGRNIMRGLLNAISGLVGSVTGKVRAVWSGIKGAFSGAAGSMATIGKNIINGLIRGINSLVKQVAAKAKEVALAAVNAIKKFLKIKSPSKVTAKLGAFFGEGFADGIGSQANTAAAEARAMADAAAKELSGGRGMLNDQNRMLGTYAYTMQSDSGTNSTLGRVEALLASIDGATTKTARKDTTIEISGREFGRLVAAHV